MPSTFGKPNREGASFSHLAVHMNGSAMRINNGFGDGKTQTCSAVFAGPGRVNTVKSVKYMGQMLFVDPRAIIPDGQFDFILLT